MEANGYHSASALEGRQKFERNKVYDSYAIENGMNGWCIFMDDYVLDKIDRLDETVSFWFSDNLYALQLKKAGIKHGLFTNVQVDHVRSCTLNSQSIRKQRHYQIGELGKYKQRERYYAETKVLH
jgi:GT2 family glycosyltransferase